MAQEPRSLPGFGGQVEDWSTYKFQVKALERKEQGLSDNERKKLGSLALRLTERLQGPALQIARTIGIAKLAEADGTTVLLKGLEEDLLPLRRQAAIELYQAGKLTWANEPSVRRTDDVVLLEERCLVGATSRVG